MSRVEMNSIIGKLRHQQAEVSKEIMASIEYNDLEKQTPDGFSVLDTLQMWGHELRSHHRDMILARGRLEGDNPPFHVPHFVRQANEEFGKFIGELSALSDEDLDRKMPSDGRTIRELAEHILDSLQNYFVQQVKCATPKEKSNGV